MRNILFIIFCMFSLGGCAASSSGKNSNESTISPINQEVVLKKTGNYPALTELYKEQLQKKEQPEIRLKLVEAYINFHDYESALFTIAPLVNSENSSHKVFYLQGVALYHLGSLTEAERSLEIACQKKVDYAKAINLLGIIHVQNQDLKGARDFFIQARNLMYDDITLKNNLALIDLLEGDYQSAATYLLPVYLNGQADEKVKANLAIIMAKLGSLNHIRALYSDKFGDEEIVQLYQALRDLTLSYPQGYSHSEVKSAELNVNVEQNNNAQTL